MLTTGADGRVTFTFASAFPAAPVITATAVDPNTADAFWFFTAVVSSTTTTAVVQVFRTTTVSLIGVGLVLVAPTTAPAGTVVHVHAAAA